MSDIEKLEKAIEKVKSMTGNMEKLEIYVDVYDCLVFFTNNGEIVIDINNNFEVFRR